MPSAWESGMNPVAITIISPRKPLAEPWKRWALAQRVDFFQKSFANRGPYLPTILMNIIWLFHQNLQIGM